MLPFQLIMKVSSLPLVFKCLGSRPTVVKWWVACWSIHAICMKIITSPLYVILESTELLKKITWTKMSLAVVFLEPSLTDLYSVSAGICWVLPRLQVHPPISEVSGSHVLWTRNWDSEVASDWRRSDSQGAAQSSLGKTGSTFWDFLCPSYHCDIYRVPLC